METTYKNKQMDPAKTKAQEEYFYPGGGEYEPATVTASSQAEADKQWEKSRIKSNQQ